MTTMHAIAIAVPLWAMATVAVVRFLRYAKPASDGFTVDQLMKARAEAIRSRGSYIPPSNTPPPPAPAQEWPLRRAQLLALAHKWRKRADESNRTGDYIWSDMLNQCATSLERELRS